MSSPALFITCFLLAAIACGWLGMVSVRDPRRIQAWEDEHLPPRFWFRDDAQHLAFVRIRGYVFLLFALATTAGFAFALAQALRR
ncbi:MAG TPA: hypothetical protein VJ600_02575 [Holophagaceae bacterium]|nr:hypothetical protein [Holophagaceae bacterium]